MGRFNLASRIKMIRLLLLTLCCLSAQAQNEELQAFMEEIQKDYKMLGVSVGAFQGNEMIMRGQVGVRQVDDPAPITENDVFYLSDAGRSITSMLVARIIEKSFGLLRWNTTISEIFYDDFDVAQPFADANLLDLLVHTGYIINDEQVMTSDKLIDWYDGLWKSSQWANSELNQQLRKEMTHFLVNLECDEEMCQKMRYSKFTYSVAVAMIEKYMNKTFDNLLQEEVFDPLGAPDCGVGPTTLDPSLPPAQPWSHFAGPWGVYNIPVLPGNNTNMPSALSPDDGIHCSMDSWKNILSAHLSRDESFLSKESWAVLQTPAHDFGGETKYAPGFIVDDSNPFVTLLYHPGSSDKEFAECLVIPEANVGMVFAANTNLQEGMRQTVGSNKILEYVFNHLSSLTGMDLFHPKKKQL